MCYSSMSIINHIILSSVLSIPASSSDIRSICVTNWEQGRHMTPGLGLVTPLTLLLRLNSVPSLVDIDDPGDDGDDGDVGDGGVGEAGSDWTVPG